MPLSTAMKTDLLNKIRDALVAIPDLQAALAYSKTRFSPSFGRTAWRTAFTSNDPADKQKVSALNWNVAQLMNELNNTIMPAVVLAELLNADQLKKAAPAHYHALKKQKLIVEQTRKDLERANRIHRDMNHDYAKATADDIYEFVALLEQLVPKVLTNLKAWLTDLGV